MSGGCPEVCQNKHREVEEDIRDIKKDTEKLFNMSIPGWARGLIIGGVLTSFIFYGSLCWYSFITYASKEEVRELKVDINGGINKLSDKMDKLIAARVEPRAEPPTIAKTAPATPVKP